MADSLTHSTLAYEPAPLPANESERRAALDRLKIVDTPEEERFDRLTRLAARLFRVPIAYVSLLETERQWFKSSVGMPIKESSRHASFCAHAILQEDILVIPDAHLDPRFAAHPFVIGQPFVRFYAGRPLRSPDGFKVGTLCLLDRSPRAFESKELELLNELAALVEREFSLTSTIEAQRETLSVKEELLASERVITKLYLELSQAREKSEDLLHTILPVEVANELINTGQVKAVSYPSATVMFTDFVGFTHIMETHSPERIVEGLNTCFTEFDRIVDRHNVEKLKTIGDGYMAVSGVAGQHEKHAHRMVRAALEIRDFITSTALERRKLGLPAWDVRIGIHSGPVIAGVVGLNKFAYDVWGDTVNVAARLEMTSAPTQIHLSNATWELVQDEFCAEPRGCVTLRNHTSVEGFFLLGPKS